jgi:mRNA interferase YafQ
MRRIKRTARFKKDYKRASKGRFATTLDRDLVAIVRLLVADQPLPKACRDHPMAGNWSNFRDCHLKPDLVLIYRKSDPETLELIRLGSHSELGL